MHTPKVMIIAGEASADLHGEKLVDALKAKAPGLQAFGIGGPGMRSHGFEAIVPSEDISVAGLTEVLFAIPRIWRIMRRITAVARERRPDVAVLIDMPDFNLRLAKRLNTLNIPVVYYISPQLWAWRQGRVKQIRERVDKMLVILPFEKDFYEKHGVPVEFVGHPLIEELPLDTNRDGARERLTLTKHKGPLIAVLPGSRHKEVSRHLPVMLAGLLRLKEKFPGLRPVIPVAHTIDRAMVERSVAASGLEADIVDGHATDVLLASDAALVCSGTSTLQTALLLRPMVVVYRVSWLSYQILKRLVKVAHIALVNLIAGRALAPELIQNAMTPKAIADAVEPFLDDSPLAEETRAAFRGLRAQLGDGNTAERVADAVLPYFDKPGRNTP